MKDGEDGDKGGAMGVKNNTLVTEKEGATVIAVTARHVDGSIDGQSEAGSAKIDGSAVVSNGVTPQKNGMTLARSPNKTNANECGVDHDMISLHTNKKTVCINNTMWIYLYPCHVNKERKVIVSAVNCNWNTHNEKVSQEIAANILLNHDGKSTKNHEPIAGNDMSVLLAHMNEVRLLFNFSPHVINYKRSCSPYPE